MESQRNGEGRGRETESQRDQDTESRRDGDTGTMTDREMERQIVYRETKRMRDKDRISKTERCRDGEIKRDGGRKQRTQ